MFFNVFHSPGIQLYMFIFVDLSLHCHHVAFEVRHKNKLTSSAIINQTVK